MKEKKDIDRLFQERFKDFEAHPSSQVWAKIEERLEEKKKRRVIPLWWKLGGVAALLALLFLIGDRFFLPADNDLKNSDPPVVAAPNSSRIKTDGRTAQPNTDQDSATEAIVFSEDGEKLVKSGENREKSTKKNNKSVNASSIVAAQDAKNSAEVENKTEAAKTTNKNRASFVENTIGKTYKNAQKPVKTGDAIAIADLSEGGNKIQQNNKKSIAANEAKAAKEDTEAERKSEKSLVQIVQEEQAAHADDETEQEKNLSRRWALTPNVAPVYYNSFSGSGIAPQFDKNTKEGRVNLSYGLLVSYAINDKFTVRSGLNKIDLSYTTNDAILSTGAQGVLQSASFKEAPDALQVQSAVKAPDEDALSNSAELLDVKTSNGFVNQSLAYLEVPMEVEYALLERKVGLQLIGGLSTMFLNSNALTFSDNDFKTALPESTNLNGVSFSTNIGLGLDYKFTDAIKFNLEPMFKYQLNAYKNSVSDFKPYYLGLYTGFSIKF